ncbi:MAG: glutamate--tRNA ligase [Clostridia bacterium]|nr:glutamate--tRNA ligase [Clostridia bacterium]
MDYKKLADLIFPDYDSDLSKFEALYPPRTLPEGAKVTRFAPSPTGLPHLGNLFSCNVDLFAARQSGGTVILRIEDTDAKRTVDDGVNKIVTMLADFGIIFDEGPTADGTEKGAYGPYIQSHRADLYRSCAKLLIEQGHAYPCFCTEEDLEAMRAKQSEANVAAPGYFGEWACCRELTYEQVKANLEAGKDYVIRLRSPGEEGKTDKFTDVVRGVMEFPQNIMDIVLLKSDGIPTYHFAHAVDDHFMRVTDVVRGDEWLPSAPVHVQLFRLLGFKQPRYVHISPVCKIDGDSKRKLSKRKDPEAGLIFYHEQGYDKDAVLEYLTSLANSNFEPWRKANPTAPLADYKFSLKNMSVSGAVFDVAKLDDVCKNYISTLTAQQVYDKYLTWAKLWCPRMAEVVADSDYWTAIFNIERTTPKPRKDISRWGMVEDYYAYFMDDVFAAQTAEGYNLGDLADRADDFKAACKAYVDLYDANDDRDTWFAKVKQVAEQLGYAPETKLYKANPDAYKGQLSQIATMLRIAFTNRAQTPDLYSILQVLGTRRVIERLQKACGC